MNARKKATLTPAEIEAKIAGEYLQIVQPLCDRWVVDVQAAAGSLHLPAEQRHDHPGWLSAISVPGLAAAGIPFSPASLDFVVPVDCPWWHEPEMVDGESVGRFFAERAWLDMSIGPGETDLVFVAGFAIQPEALWGLQVHVDGAPLEKVEVSPLEAGLHLMRFRTQEDLQGPVRVEFSSPVAARVTDIHPHSTDRRYLSLLITRPSWEAMPADGED